MQQFSYQLYSSREFPPLTDTLRMLADLGYTQVEGFGGSYNDLAALTDGLSKAALTMPTGHISLDMLENEPDKALEIAQAIGMKYVYCPHIEASQRPDNAGDWLAFGQRIEKAGEVLRAAGIGFGWHNHDFEFVPQADGSIPMEEVFKGGPSLSWEADIAWIVRGGADPFDWIDRYGDRISTVHIKDIAPEGDCLDEDGWADVGFGTMDWKALWSALSKTPAEYFVMEHDKPSDHARFASRSINTVRAL